MKYSYLASTAFLVAGAILAAPSARADDTEVLARGPLHEAFAEVVAFNPQPGITVPDKPPDPIDEIPPEQRPDDDAAMWIPGYWAWDQDRDDFIWVSGVWRVPPPGGQWIPGYWTQVENGWQWIAGYWYIGSQDSDASSQQVSEVQYLPTPPESLEAGPTSPSPGDDQFWVPGCWNWQDTRYVWRPGNWSRIEPDMVWIPDHYCWTPPGCVFLRGHWDYVMARRGLPFCPVFFPQPIYTRPGFQYSPTVVLNTNVLQYNLFCWPQYQHYYFGDYFAPSYVDAGIRPCFDFYQGRVAYDPFYVHDRWYYGRENRDWDQRVRGWYRYRADHPEARPPHNFHDLERVAGRTDFPGNRLLNYAMPLDRARTMNNFPMRLTNVDVDTRNRFTSISRDVNRFAHQRMDWESHVRRPGEQIKEPFRQRLPQNSPIVSHGRLDEARLRRGPERVAQRPDFRPGGDRDRPGPDRDRDRPGPDRGGPGRPDIGPPGGPGLDRPDRSDGNRPGRPDFNRPGQPGREPDRNIPGRREDNRPGRPDFNRPGGGGGRSPEGPGRDRPERPDRQGPGRRGSDLPRDPQGRMDLQQPGRFGSNPPGRFGTGGDRFNRGGVAERPMFPNRGGAGEAGRGRQGGEEPRIGRAPDRFGGGRSAFGPHSPGGGGGGSEQQRFFRGPPARQGGDGGVAGPADRGRQGGAIGGAGPADRGRQGGGGEGSRPGGGGAGERFQPGGNGGRGEGGGRFGGGERGR